MTFRPVSLLVLTAALLTPLTLSAQDASTAQRLERAERDLATLQRVVYQGQNPPPSLPGGDTDTQQQLADMNEALRSLTGQVEALSNRVMQLERGAGIAAPAAETAPGVPQPLGAPQPIAAGTVPGTAMPLPPPPGAESRSLEGAEIQGVAPAEDADADTEKKTDDSLRSPDQYRTSSHAAYAQGYQLISNQDYVAAEAMFRNFLKDYPNDPLAGNAQYWLAESHYARKDYAKAAEGFLTTYQKYPKNSKAADALLKLGLSLSSLDNGEQACATLDRLAEEYPAAAPSLMQRAESEKQKLGCS